MELTKKKHTDFLNSVDVNKILEKIKDTAKILILAHGDLDGIVSAIMIKNICKNLGNKVVEVVFTLPKWINKHTNVDVYDLIIIVDLAVNNRNPNSAREFLKKYGHKTIWIDHHYCPSDISEIITDPTYKSCVHLLYELFGAKFFVDVEWNLMLYAHQSDQGKGNNIYHKSLKVNQRSDETRYEIYRQGTAIRGGELYKKSLDRIERKAEYYENVIVPNTFFIIENNVDDYDRIAVVDIRHERDRSIDMTLLAFELYKRFDFVVIKYYGSNKKENEFLKISRRSGLNINLVNLFNLKSGAPFKITIPNTYTNSDLVHLLNVCTHELNKDEI